MKFTCLLSTQSKIPAVHLDREVTKDPTFKPKKTNDFKLLSELNDQYKYLLSGKLEEVSNQLEALNHNLELATKYNELR